MAEGSGKQGEANAPERSEGKGSGCVCLQSLEGLQQQRLTLRESAIALQVGERPGLSGPSRALMKAALTVLLVAVDPLMGGLAGYAEAFSELGDRIVAQVAQLVVFEEPLSLFAHGSTSLGHGTHLL